MLPYIENRNRLRRYKELLDGVVASGAVAHPSVRQTDLTPFEQLRAAIEFDLMEAEIDVRVFEATAGELGDRLLEVAPQAAAAPTPPDTSQPVPPPAHELIARAHGFGSHGAPVYGVAINFGSETLFL